MNYKVVKHETVKQWNMTYYLILEVLQQIKSKLYVLKL